MIELDFDKVVCTVFAELEKYSLGFIVLAGRGHKELKIVSKEKISVGDHNVGFCRHLS